MLPPRYQPTGLAIPGGMGAVLQCHDTVLERNVAIKVIQHAVNNRRMVDELRAMLRMRSKHVVQVYDVIQLPGHTLGMVQEFIEGVDLFDPSSAPTNAADFYKQLWQIASGISDIHALGVIHRDIKPNNMKIDPEGVVKIYDFGLARDDGAAAATVGFVGTPGFAAPELYGANVNFTSAVDTYAFGASALYICNRALQAELMAQPPDLRRGSFFAGANLSIAPEIADLLEACLNVDPTARPSMAVIRDALARHILFDRHQALIVFQRQTSFLNAANRVVTLDLFGSAHIEIRYDGLRFCVASWHGDVRINNRLPMVGRDIPNSCVVALSALAVREFITFDLSHPEIVL